MPEYEVNLYYTGFITMTINAENEEEAIQKARDEQSSPCKQDTFTRRFEPILNLRTLERLRHC